METVGGACEANRPPIVKKPKVGRPVLRLAGGVMYQYPKSEASLSRWILLAIAPGLVCDALGVLSLVVDSEAFSAILSG